jgi:hypothetical protein
VASLLSSQSSARRRKPGISSHLRYSACHKQRAEEFSPKPRILSRRRLFRR